eukprot:5684439-Amphidinium_carterae.1
MPPGGTWWGKMALCRRSQPMVRSHTHAQPVWSAVLGRRTWCVRVVRTPTFNSFEAQLNLQIP